MVPSIIRCECCISSIRLRWEGKSFTRKICRGFRLCRTASDQEETKPPASP
uniref:Uncharacterized protein n=1 Tax=Anguilla anguilla TaxID=7936 RepID=A0A0E9TQW7_ANGAN